MRLTFSKFDWFAELFGTFEPDEELERSRIRFAEKHVGLPVRAAYLGILVYFLFFVYVDVGETSEVSLEAFRSLRHFFPVYFVLNLAVSFVLWGMDGLPLRLIQYSVFTLGLLDALFIAALTLVEDGFQSSLYWVFASMIVRNAVSVPNTGLQIVLNLAVSLCYVLAGIMDVAILEMDEQFRVLQERAYAYSTEPFVLRLALLLLLTACCFGLQLLLDKQRKVEAESQEFALRQEQLRSTGRLAAEIAHQLKNPLGIINNAAFTLQRRLVSTEPTLMQQVDIIRDEITRSDRIINELMGYSRLIEGKVERLNVVEEIERAISQVFPGGTSTGVKVHRDYSRTLPALLAQRSHMEEVFVNLLKNAREAMEDQGNIWITARYAEGYSVQLSFRDDGPGIDPENLERIFEAYFTTKLHGSGLGMAIIKNNTEMYGGTIRVESSPGAGTRFELVFPGRTLLRVK